MSRLARPTNGRRQETAAARPKTCAATVLIAYLRRWYRTSPAWLTSFLLHVVAAILLVLVPYRHRLLATHVVIETRLDDSELTVEFARLLEPDYEPGDSMSGGSTPATPHGTDQGSVLPDIPTTSTEDLPPAPPIAKLPNIGLGALPQDSQLTMDVSVKGDPIAVVGGVGDAIDQITREILTRLSKGPVLVIWMFDESRSMQDEQQDIKGRFHRVYQELAERPETRNDALLTAVVAFGKDLHFVLEKPTADVPRIREAIDQIPVDPSGQEWPCKYLIQVARKYEPFGRRGRRQLMLILVTDESGERSPDGLTPLDGAFLEDAIAAAVKARMAVYVIGREAVFGYPFAQVPYRANGRSYHLRVTRGPEAPDVECLQTIGLRPTRPFLLSGFGPWELVRLVRETGGIYFLSPADEPGRPVTYAFDPLVMRNYLPYYGPRTLYVSTRDRSKLRAAMYDVIKRTARVGVPLVFPSAPAAFTQQAARAIQQSRQQRAVLAEAYRVLQQVAPLYDSEDSPRWRAAFDLMAAELAAFQVRLYSYESMLAKLMKDPPKPSRQPPPGHVLRWEVLLCPHTKHDWIGDDEGAVEARKRAIELLQQVIDTHPRTPWARLARIHLDVGLSVRLVEVFVGVPPPGVPRPTPRPPSL